MLKSLEWGSEEMKRTKHELNCVQCIFEAEYLMSSSNTFINT
jgi:hypothetical protein